MNKRKIILLALSLCMVAILAVGGTLAYFTDTDNAVNTFTVGNVQIELIEQQRDFVNGQQIPGSAIEDFEDDKKLFPIVGSAQGEKDDYGLPTAKNYLDKIISVGVLDGSEDAYVRVLVAIPAALDAGSSSAANVLHFNLGNKFATGAYNGPVDHKNWLTWELVHENVDLTNDKDEDIIPGKYHIYMFTYMNPVSENNVTGSACVVGFYLDANVDFDGTNYTLNGTKIDYDLAKGVSIPVFAQGVQSAGFVDKNGNGTAADEAFTDAKMPTNPWAN